MGLTLLPVMLPTTSGTLMSVKQFSLTSCKRGKVVIVVVVFI